MTKKPFDLDWGHLISIQEANHFQFVRGDNIASPADPARARADLEATISNIQYGRQQRKPKK